MKSKAGASPYIVWMVVFVAVPLAIVVCLKHGSLCTLILFL